MGCDGEVAFHEQCDARQKYGLKGPVKSLIFTVESYKSDKSSLLYQMDKIYDLPNTICEFDRNGNISSVISPYNTTKYYFNKQHRLTKTKTKTCYEDKSYEDKRVYDREGLLIHRELQVGSGEWYPEHKQTIDIKYISECDTLIEYTYKDKRVDMEGNTIDDTTSPVVIRYSTDGNPISISSPGADVNDADVNGIFDMRRYMNWDTFSSLAYFDYDTEGRITSKRFYNRKNEVVYQRTYQYDANGRLTVSAEIGGYRDGSGEWENAGRMNGSKIKYYSFAPITILSYSYDNDQDPTARSVEIVFDYNSAEHDWKRTKEVGNVTYAHEYDKYGNWITRLIYIDQSLCRIEKREITYYGGDSSRYSEEYVKQARDIADKQRQQEEERRRKIEEQPIEIEFTKAAFHLDSYDRVTFTFAAKLRNISDKTFISADFDEEYVGNNLFGEYTSKRLGTYITMDFNKQYILRHEYFSKSIPYVSFDTPWEPKGTKIFELNLTDYDDLDCVTKGFMKYTPQSCILHMLIIVEEPNGRKTTMPMQFNLTNAWHQFVNSNQ